MPNKKPTAKNAEPKVDFHGGTLIDPDGKEVPITEKMVRQAIRQLDPKAYPQPDQKSDEKPPPEDTPND
ncbi:MAG: hypothetical protein GDA55_04190 [Cellvibrionales bacterium]|nr:hypothetical protein [Cellvibrionales bacterium]